MHTDDVVDERQGVPTPQQRPEVRWTPLTRIAFRFSVVYLGLFCMCSEVCSMLLNQARQYRRLPAPWTWWLRPLVQWAEPHLFDAVPVPWSPAGISDRPAGWAMLFWIFVVAVVATVVWSTLDRRRGSYVQLHRWFRVVVRFGLLAVLFFYGIWKLIPLQMPMPLYRLVEPFGDFTPAGVLWTQVGASRPYEMLLGSAEVLAALLLIVPRTATAGALLAAIDMTQVFVLNMTFDVPLKTVTFHLVLLSLFLLAPDARRLANVLVLNRTAEPSTQATLFRTRRANRAALAVQLALGAWILGWYVGPAWTSWTRDGGGAPLPALYGIWDVDEYSLDGVDVAAAVTDPRRWHRIIIDRGDMSRYQLMDGSIGGRVAVDMNAHHIRGIPNNSPHSTTTLTFTRVTPDRLILDGTLAGHRVHMTLSRDDLARFPLERMGFRWSQPGAQIA